MLANKLVTADSDMRFAGVVAGNNPGQVWADNAMNPSSAIVWSSGLEGFNFMGSASNTSFNQSIATYIDHEIIPFLRNKKINSFEFSVDTDEWYPAIYQFIGNRKIDDSFQYVYKSNLNNHEPPCLNHVVPYQAVEIDQAFALELMNGEVKNADYLLNYIEQYWGTLDNFLEKGYGYAALTANKEVASLAISSAMYGSAHAIGLETLEDYQRQGLSSSLVKLLLHKFSENKIIAWWDCMESNIASQKNSREGRLR
ncbi:acetyltransferase [Paenibacillus dendritiformis]|uniref:GNAT family N-acetyltransferase n=1 Tax=Paenibacillus TaxID=44249 RepID=UPI001B2F09B1|nr:GNAT family N-acetyltransferase [Paenibacillus dendritiformis]GIO81838.1 acetyltransferase [Paenibacillus dendritiformis]